jgi:hypothetical protein
MELREELRGGTHGGVQTLMRASACGRAQVSCNTLLGVAHRLTCGGGLSG